MEPLSALSIATAVIQFLDFTEKVVSGTWKIYKSNPGDTESNSDIRGITKSLIKVNDELLQAVNHPNLRSFSSDDEEIIKLGSRCNEIGGRLISALDQLQTQSKHQLWASFRIALRSIWTQGEIDTLCKTLDAYRQQISMHLLVSLREQVTSANTNHGQQLNETQLICREILKEIAKSVQWQTNIIEAIKKSHSQRLPGSRLVASPAQMHDMTRVNDVNEISRHLLNHLYFQEMDQRYERIALAHQETFKWLFHPPSEGSQWTDFSDWIKSDDQPLYWITGKAGAGKSTLMRYIFDHQQTQDALQVWAANCPLRVASFFFWNSGSEMQMSYEGLVRTLMYQILKQSPELIPVIFPYRVEIGLLFGEGIIQQTEMPWIWEELLKAFRIMIKEVTKSSKIIFFIDGMDEFKGKPSDLVNFITELISPGVKICTSSRPWIDFEDVFGHRPHLRLEDLTYNDIKRFVTSKMTTNAGFKVFQQLDPTFSSQLIENVCVKSSGVFLWVFLVTESLLTGLSEGERLSDLQRRLESLPADLEDLFEKILDRLDTWHFERASQLFQLVRASYHTLTLQDMSFADEDDPEFAVKAPCRVLGEQEAAWKAELMRRRINACCKGLLEAKPLPAMHLSVTEVTFLHRTVKDFLEREDTWSRICAATSKEFNIYLRLYNTLIMRLKTQDIERLKQEDFQDWVAYAIEYAVRADPDCSTCQVTLLNEIDITAKTLTTIPLRNGITLQQFWNAQTYWTEIMKDMYRITSFLVLATQCQLVDYVDATLQDMARPKVLKTATELLFIATKHYHFKPFASDPSVVNHTTKNEALVRVLLQHGANPNHRPKSERHTAWENLLFEARYSDQLGFIKAFLEFGADPKNAEFKDRLETGRLPSELREIIKKRKEDLSHQAKKSGIKGKREKFWLRLSLKFSHKGKHLSA